MAGIVVNNLNLKPGQCIGIKGVVPKDAKSFAINLGKDSSSYVPHLNPRFDEEGYINTVVRNSKEADEWGTEYRDYTIPFQHGETREVCKMS
ncbi:galectin-1-like isoform X2 [Rhinatrema bivittatum]|uniref:galectin-1-like isoform X2 n=1 Tax=Rhinatrema bivittatum TaxID=194408 RepID=UPI00112B2773|nr:galectin-1-like isoform X2 [Rhinatrema bivittatum]